MRTKFSSSRRSKITSVSASDGRTCDGPRRNALYGKVCVVTQRSVSEVVQMSLVTARRQPSVQYAGNMFSIFFTEGPVTDYVQAGRPVVAGSGRHSVSSP